MFDIGWSELLVIGVVLIVVVGPKDLPRMLRTFGRTTTQLRRMAGDFRKQFDEALREAEMEDVRDSVNDLKSLNPASDIRKAMNPMRAVGDEIRSSLMAATRAPEPKIPSATEPAAPAEPPIAAAGEAQPLANTAAETPSSPVVAEPALVTTGLNGAHREGDTK
jgi:sec-independent protein translocase protein TatB